MPLSFRRKRYIWLQIQAASHLVNFFISLQNCNFGPKWNDPFVEIVTSLFHWWFTMVYSKYFCPVLAVYYILSLSCLLCKNSKNSSTFCFVLLGLCWCLLFGFCFACLFLTKVILSSGALARSHLPQFLHKHIQCLRSCLFECNDNKTLFNLAISK